MNLDKYPDPDRILGLIKRRGEQRGAEIAAALGITGEAARQQLVKLAEQGLVRARAENRGVGRPTQNWSLTPAGHARFPDTHAELTLRLIEALRSEFGEAALDRIIEVRETDTLSAYRAELDGLSGLGDRIERLARIRSREGYMAEIRIDGDGFLLTENHCPICAAAKACQGFCRAELDIFRAVLGTGVTVERVEHIPAGARRCAYRIASVIAPVEETNHDLDRGAPAR